MKHLTLVIGTMLAVSLAAHVAIAQLRPPIKRQVPGTPWNPKLPPKQKLVIEEYEGTVYIEGKDQIYFVAARNGELLEDGKVVAGPMAKANFPGFSTQQGIEFDVFVLTPLGTVGAEGFKPCFPNPNHPDCTPVGFPPDLSPRFKRKRIPHLFY